MTNKLPTDEELREELRNASNLKCMSCGEWTYNFKYSYAGDDIFKCDTCGYAVRVFYPDEVLH